jgi:hypothetical protein
MLSGSVGLLSWFGVVRWGTSDCGWRVSEVPGTWIGKRNL